MSIISSSTLCRKAVWAMTLTVATYGMLRPAQVLHAQRFNGRIVGIVTDPSGAVVPGARVTVKNQLTGVEYTPAETDSKGYYVIPAVPEGQYVVKIEHSGFRTTERTGIEVGVDQDARIDVELEVGSTSQSVTVQGQAPLINTESATIASSVDRVTITSMPTGFPPAVLDLLFFSPGITSYHGAANGDSNFSVNGGPSNTQVTVLDGANIVVPGSGTYWYQGRPTVQEVQTIKWETAPYSAEFGGMANINMTTVSGNNQLHGNVYFYKSTPGLQARTFFESKVSPFAQNDFGFTVGAPIKKNKTFYTFTFFVNRAISPSAQIVTVPTAAELQGNFSGFPTIYDPATTVSNPSGSGYVRTAFANNVIPTTRFDPVATSIMTAWPSPNVAGNANNFNNQLLSGSALNTTNQTGDSEGPFYAVKIDENISDRHHLFGRYEYTSPWTGYAHVFPGPGGVNYWNQGYDDIWTVAIGDTFSLSPTKLNEFRAYVTSNLNARIDDVTNYDSQFKLNGFGLGYPYISISGVQSISLGPTQLPSYTVPNATGVSDNISIIHGAHTIKFGGGYRAEEFNTRNGYRWPGQFSFSGMYTNNPQASAAGNGFADFLLGLSSGVSAQNPGNVYGYREKNFYLFVQDTYKVLPKLTVNLGLRYEYYGGVNEQFNRIDTFSPTVTNSVTGTLGGLIFAGNNGAPTAFNGARNNIAPRLGLAYSLGKNTVLRSGAGIFYAENTIGFTQAATTGFDPLPVSLTSTITTPALILQNGLAGGLPSSTLSRTSGIANNTGVNMIPSYSPSPTIYQWSLGIQRQLPGRTMVEADYVGTRGVHLWFPRSIDQVPPSLLGTPQDIANDRLVTPYPQYTGVQMYASDGSSAYNSAQLRMVHRFAHGLDVSANYTYSHSTNNTSYSQSSGAAPVQNLYNLRAEWANSDDNSPNAFYLSLVYEIPKFLPGDGIASRYLGRGWQINNGYHITSGFPIDPGVSLNQSFAFAGSERPNCIGNPSLSGSAQSIHDWFNLSAFSLPALYTFGSCGRNVIVGPDYNQWDFSLFKNTYFRFFWSENANIQFRAEAVNFTNHPSFSNPNATIGSAAAGTITGESSPPRQIDLGIRFVF